MKGRCPKCGQEQELYMNKLMAWMQIDCAEHGTQVMEYAIRLNGGHKDGTQVMVTESEWRYGRIAFEAPANLTGGIPEEGDSRIQCIYSKSLDDPYNWNYQSK